MTDHATLGRTNKRTGRQAEEVAAMVLRMLGAQFVQRIEVGWRVVRKPLPPPQKGTRIVGASPLQKVAGDIRAVGPGGRSVLCEVKHTGALKLSLSAFDAHQVVSLMRHSECGGLSLVAWVTDAGCVLLQWPFAPLT